MCPPGYILNTATKQCSCPTPYYFLQGLCLQSCPVSYFANTTSASCESCDASCAACSSKGNCSSCVFGFFLEDAQCVSVCLTGYYQSPLDLNCQKCYSRCASCTSYSVCQSCKAGSVLFKEESICLSTCPQSYIKDPATNTCLLQGICQSICKYCDVSNKCRECEYPYYIHLDACVDKCPTYFYEINVNRTCASCFEGCKVCNGPLESQCADKYLNGSTTDDPSDDEDIYADLTQGGYKKPKKSQEERYCHLSCDKCVGKEFTHCVTCPQNRILKPIEGKNYGECQCPDGYSDQLYQYCKGNPFLGAPVSCHSLAVNQQASAQTIAQTIPQTIPQPASKQSPKQAPKQSPKQSLKQPPKQSPNQQTNSQTPQRTTQTRRSIPPSPDQSSPAQSRPESDSSARATPLYLSASRTAGRP